MRLFCLLIFMLFESLLHGQTNAKFSDPVFPEIKEFRFSHLTEEDGLSDNHPWAAFMDRQGFLWLGTPDGISRYDGHRFLNISQMPTDDGVIESAMVVDILEDEAGILWLASLGDGLIRFDPISETFQAFTHDPESEFSISGNDVSCLLLGEDGEIWVGTYSAGFNLFDPKEESFKRYNLSEKIQNSSEAFRLNSIHEMLVDPGGRNKIWLAANNGIYEFDVSEQAINRYASEAENTSGMSCHALWAKDENSLWVGTWGGGMVDFHIPTKKWDYFPPNPPAWEGRSAMTNVVYDISPKSEEEMWVCTQDQGLLVFNKKTKAYSVVPYGESDPFKLPENAIRKIYVDPQERIWVLNYNQGISLANPANDFFRYHAVLSNICTEAESHEISDFAWDEVQKRLYVAYSGCEGLFVFDENYQPLPGPIVVGRNDPRRGYKTVVVDKQGKVWVGGRTNIGNEDQFILQHSFLTYDPQKNTLSPVETNIPIQDYDVTDIIEDSKNRLWLGTKGGGLIVGDMERQIYKQYVQSESTSTYISPQTEIYELLEDQEGYIWIATEAEGVYRFDPREEVFLSIPTKSKEIRTIAKDQRGHIWVGMKDAGIEIFDPTETLEHPIKRLKKSDGLASKRITGIICDIHGDVWIGTESGLCRYQKESNKILTFSTQNGLRNTYLLQMGLTQIREREILIGQPNGFFDFLPDDLYKTVVADSLVITDLQSFEKSLKFEKNINNMEEVVLDYAQNFFSISFMLLDYDQIDKHRYAYKLEGYDMDWVYPSDGRTFASYTNVREGNYIFQVKAENALNGDILNIRQFTIRIQPPWYRSWLAYACYAILILGSMLFVLLQIRQRTRIKHQRELEALELKKMKELDEMKTRFFANISHEFRTPLTIIQGLSDEVVEKISRMEKGTIRDRLQTIKRNSFQLLNLVKQILDLAKLEAQALKPQMIQGNIVAYLTYLVESFESLAEMREIDLKITHSNKSILMDYDPERLRDIINNLLSNAIKFTPQGGKVVVSVTSLGKNTQENQSYKRAEGLLKVAVSDTGRGIPEGKLPHVFERFYQVDDTSTRAREGTGIGLALCKELVELFDGKITVESRLDEGTTFFVLLPIMRNAPLESITNQGMVAKPIPLEIENTLEEESTPILEIKDNEEKPIILLAEDNKDVVKYLKSCLEDNYKLVFAYDGLDGIEKAKQLIPDLIISDVMMPYRDGFELTDALKQDEKTSHVPIILLTARAAIEDKLSGLKRGADAYLTKPFLKEELLIRIQSLLEIRQKLRKRYASLGAINPSKDIATQQEDNFLIRLHKELIPRLEDTQLDVPALAEAMAMSRSQLHRKLKAITGYSTNAYIRMFRMKRGRQMLEETSQSISEIAYAIGYNDPNYFSRVFSKEFGKTPTEFREAASLSNGKDK